MKKYINKKWQSIQWYNKLIIVTTGTVLLVSPLVTIPAGVGLEMAYSQLKEAVVAFESTLGNGLGWIESLSLNYIAYVVVVALVPLTVGITAHVLSNKKPVKHGKRDGLKYETVK